MKKVLMALFLTGFLISSCASSEILKPTLITLAPTNTPTVTPNFISIPTPTEIPTFTPSPAATESSSNLDRTFNGSIESFEFSENCPNVCFMGIKPLETTPLEALHILKKSPDIDQATIYILSKDGMTLTKNLNDSSILNMKEGDVLEAVWAPNQQYIHMTETNGRIDYIDASPASTIQDFIKVIGEPDKIAVHGELPPDAPYWISYAIFYSKWKLIVAVFVASIDGPKADDEVYNVALNQKINEADWQSWQGYGKMKIYMTSEQLSEYERYAPDTPSSQP